MAAVRSPEKLPQTIVNLTYASSVLSVLAYVCSGYDIERRPEYPYNIVLIPLLCTGVHHYFFLDFSNLPNSTTGGPAHSSLKSIVLTAVLSSFWFVAMHIHSVMCCASVKGGGVPTLALAKAFGTVESIVLATIAWEACGIRLENRQLGRK